MCLDSAGESVSERELQTCEQYSKKTLNYLVENCTPAKELPADHLYLDWGVSIDSAGDSSFRYARPRTSIPSIVTDS